MPKRWPDVVVVVGLAWPRVPRAADDLPVVPVAMLKPPEFDEPTLRPRHGELPQQPLHAAEGAIVHRELAGHVLARPFRRHARHLVVAVHVPANLVVGLGGLWNVTQRLAAYTSYNWSVDGVGSPSGGISGFACAY